MPDGFQGQPTGQPPFFEGSPKERAFTPKQGCCVGFPLTQPHKPLPKRTRTHTHKAIDRAGQNPERGWTTHRQVDGFIPVLVGFCPFHSLRRDTEIQRFQVCLAIPKTSATVGSLLQSLVSIPDTPTGNLDVVPSTVSLVFPQQLEALGSIGPDRLVRDGLGQLWSVQEFPILSETLGHRLNPVLSCCYLYISVLATHCSPASPPPNTLLF